LASPRIAAADSRTVSNVDTTCLWRIPILAHKFLQNPSLVMLALIDTIVA
jgi:hypothetical protein